MSYHDLISVGELAHILGTGAKWSTMAAIAGFENGCNFRRHCLSRGLRRKIKSGVIVVIAEPT